MSGVKERQEARRISVRGVVQGVGFRPFVYNLAQRYDIHGWVLNTSAGVEIEAEGASDRLTAFIWAIESETPLLARIESVAVQDVSANGYSGFEIRASEAQAGAYQLISPDVAACDACLQELSDPRDRRYRYPFINCTNCGPRFTIISDIPYDRPNTTMRSFAMCSDCQEEYEDPGNRRFHAQPNACPACGPHVWLEVASSDAPPLEQEAALAAAVRHLLAGRIVAIKGLGGFHLACDATNPQAVARLRSRKRRPNKPLAVMLPDVEGIGQHCDLDEEVISLLTSPQQPIILLPWRADSQIAQGVAPGQVSLGVMLPYTPLHHILLRDVDRPLVMTSGNLSEEPICQTNEEARQRLGDIADVFLLHNRDIHARYDDSVWFMADKPQPVRRSRGYAPHPVRLPLSGESVLACGAELKNTFCLTRDTYGFVSQHIGDLENWETLQHYEASVRLYERLFRANPTRIAYDLHPDYMATRYGLARGQAEGLPALGIQHHHAHIAACLADNGRADAVIGLALDGTGYGLDGKVWGGEVLIADLRGFRRVTHLEYLPLVGGEAAIRRPDRLAYGYLSALLGDVPDLPAFSRLSQTERRFIQRQEANGIHSPLTSSAGRLFDVVSALLNICHEATYEAQAAMELETAATVALNNDIPLPYPFDWDDDSVGETWGDTSALPDPGTARCIRLKPLLSALLADIKRGEPAARCALRVHVTLAEMLSQLALWLAETIGMRTVALSGGCWQNRILLRWTHERLVSAGFEVLIHRQVPANDGGLSLGQAAIALACDTI